MKEVAGNDENKLISVIIPVYNTEKYLRECLNSIINQTYNNLEIICVDDGSTDSSADIIREYARLDERIVSVFNAHQGPSIARNTALDIAKGELIYFIDSDDYLEKEALKELCQHLEQNKLDLLFFDVRAFGEEGFSDKADKENKTYKMNNDYSAVYSGAELLDRMVPKDDYLYVIWRYIVSRELIGNMRFIPNIFYSEDGAFTYELMLKSKRASFYHKVLHHRRYRENSMMTSNRMFERVYGQFVLYWDMIQKTIDYSGGYSNIRESQIKLLNKVLSGGLYLYRNLPDTEKNRLEELTREEQLKFYVSFDSSKIAKKEKADLMAKLQKTYDEKAERGIRIKELEKELERLRASKDYKVGHIILWLPRKLKRLIGIR